MVGVNLTNMPMPNDRCGILELSLHSLVNLLHLPKDVKFFKVRQSWEQEQRGVFEVLVASPILEKTLPGQDYPWVRCTIHNEFCNQDEISHIVRGEIGN